jgi:hypothetical protein
MRLSVCLPTCLVACNNSRTAQQIFVKIQLLIINEIKL